MKITDVRVRKVAKEGKLKAVVSITLDDEFVVHDITNCKTRSIRLHRENSKLRMEEGNVKKSCPHRFAGSSFGIF